ncbi:MAG: 16S rRNA (guanine(527)-N(7))-methyltransferase RsmG, partial [Actinomycetes bacterium]
GWCLPLVRPGGCLLAMKGDRAEEELREAERVLRRLGAGSWSVEMLGAGVVDPPVRLVRVVRGVAARRLPPGRHGTA